MSLLSQLFPQTISTTRLQSGTGIQQTYQSYLKNIACFIQPYTAEMAAKTNLVFGKTFNCYVDIGVDIIVGDNITDQDGNQYSVAGIMARNYGGNPHTTLTLIMEEKQ